MKKILLILVAALGLTATAQTGFQKGDTFITGSFKSVYTGVNEDEVENVNLQLNKFVTKSISVGAEAGFDSKHVKISNYVLGIHARQYITPESQFSLFAQVGMNVSIPSSGETSTFVWSAGPGINYFLSKRFAVETSLAAVSYKTYPTNNESFNIDVNLSDVKFGVIYKF
jgi:outer membrane protein